MIITISGAVGSGKTSISNLLVKYLKNYKIIYLNELAKDFKICDVKEIQTFDFDIEKLLIFIEKKITNEKNLGNNLILEGHFSHLINPKFVDKLFIINRDLKELKKTYEKRNYNSLKISDNLEVEAFNLCFYEGLEEGYKEEKQIFCIKNLGDLGDIVKKIIEKIK